MGTYYELKISINPDVADIVSEVCFDKFDCKGVITEEETYKNLELVSRNDTTLKAFLNSANPRQIDLVLRQLKRDFINRGLKEEEFGSLEFSLDEKEDEDWSRKWKEHWDVTHVGKNLSIVPSWLEYTPKSKDEIIIKLDPGSAFGTGTHPTTQLCMLAMQKYLQPYSNFADIGTGSGILSIYAKKMGASYVYGCDNDTSVIQVARENATKNNVSCIFQPNTADKITEHFDFICANILHNVLIEIMPDLEKLMVYNSRLVLSGILTEKKRLVENEVKNCKLDIIDEIVMGDWTAIVASK